jgi:predicted transcriptional regulator
LKSYDLGGNGTVTQVVEVLLSKCVQTTVISKKRKKEKKSYEPLTPNTENVGSLMKMLLSKMIEEEFTEKEW